MHSNDILLYNQHTTTMGWPCKMPKTMTNQTNKNSGLRSGPDDISLHIGSEMAATYIHGTFS